MKSVVELGWELTWAGASSHAFTGKRRNEQFNELLGKVPEVASINEFERPGKTKNGEKKMHGNGIQLRQIWSVCTGLGLPIPVPEAPTASDELWSIHGSTCVSFRHCSSVNMIEC